VLGPSAEFLTCDLSGSNAIDEMIKQDWRQNFADES
jgi:hypothetical protein